MPFLPSIAILPIALMTAPGAHTQQFPLPEIAVASNDDATNQNSSVNQPSTTSQPISNEQVINECDSWIRSRHDTAKPEVRRVAERGICLDTVGSGLDADITARFVSAISAIPEKYRPIIVVRSVGGPVSNGLTIAETMVKRHPIVAASMFCMSSCANYIMMAGSERIILPGSFLLFHGGVPRTTPEWVKKRIQAAHGGDIDPATWARMKARDTEDRARQDALQHAMDVDPSFFDWFETMNGEDKDFGQQCRGMDKITAFVLSDNFLAKNGMVIDENRGPKTDAEVSSELAKYGLSETTCYWH